MASTSHSRLVSPRLNVLAVCMAMVLGTSVVADPVRAAEIATPRSNQATISKMALTQPFRSFKRSVGRAGDTSAPSATTRIAASFPVSNCDDVGPGSLRDALDLATTDGDVIDLTTLICSKITLTSGALEPAAEVTLLGPGQDKLTIDGNATDRVLASDYSLTLHDLTISNGQLPADAKYGGCIKVDGDLGLYGSTISGCVVSSATEGLLGGAGAFVSGDLEMAGTTLSGNTVISTGAGFGGGAMVGGMAYLYESVISGNTISGTNPVSSSKYGLVSGGGLFASEAEIYYCEINNNSVSVIKGTAYGGGVAAFTPTYGGSGPGPSDPLLVTGGSTISGNTAHSDMGWSYGGGIAVGKNSTGTAPGSGAAALFASTISGNTVSSDCADCTIQGGGVSAFGTVVVKYSTVRDNQALLTSSSTGVAYGGGVATRLNASYYGTGLYDGIIAVVESTISGNSAVGGTVGGGHGGGLAALMSPFALANSTVSFNQASSSGGGGVQGVSGTGGSDSFLYSSIMANNQAPSGADVATVSSSNYLSFDGENSLVVAASPRIQLPSDTLTDDPMLQPLACNGGWTATHALTVGSPAIDAGAADDDDWDQRGPTFVRNFGAGVDIGAFELQDPPDVIFADGFETPIPGRACR